MDNKFQNTILRRKFPHHHSILDDDKNYIAMYITYFVLNVESYSNNFIIKQLVVNATVICAITFLI